jgi:4-hydroxy-tetrahydrodipicolinate synthase
VVRDVFRGAFTALPTPFRGGELDLPALDRLIERQAAAGTRGIVPAGTTGEAATLTEAELERVFAAAVEAARGRLQVVAGVGTNCTRTTVERARLAERIGADGLLVVTPYYNRPSPEGLFRHFSAVAEAVSLPIVLYDIPGRTGVDLPVDVVRRLADAHESVVAVKLARRSLERVRALVELDRVAVLAGEDGLLLDFLRAGAIGSIGVVANLVPHRVARLVELASADSGRDDDRALAEAGRIADELAPLGEALFVEVNPVPLKTAMAAMGLCGDEVRLPLAPLIDENRRTVERALAAAGLAAERSVAGS